MSNRHRQLRRLSTEEDTDESDAFTLGSAKLPSPPKATGRPTRKAAVAATTAIIESDKGSMKLHVRTPPSRLAEVTGGSNRPSRGSRKRAIVEESSDEDDDAEGEDEDEDEEMVDAEDDEEEDEDAEGEEDEEMEGLPPPPPVKPKATSKSTSTTSKPVAKPAAPPPRITKAAISAAIKEKDESDDDELSSLGSLEEEEEDEDAEGEDDMDETNANINDDGEEEEDAEGEIDDEMAGVDSDGIPFDDEDTPDLSRLTRRQRAVHDLEDFDESLVSLSNEAQKKKHLTAEEYAMRRAEMARRRKTLSEKRNEEEKFDTINRLLKRQAPKRQKKEDKNENDAEGRAPMSFVRIISNKDGTRLAIPDQWLDAPVGEIFKQSQKPSMKSAHPQRMVEEVS